MRFQPAILDEIRARLPVSSVVGRRVRLKKAGREWKGLSPFNAEKTPSFYVNDQKGFYHCFSSGKHGDIFTFLIETEGVTFPEAVERLAAEAGVDLPEASPEAERAVERRRDLHEVLELACRFFEGQLQRQVGAEARAYLNRRAVTPATQAEFRIGYAPNSRSALLEHLRGQRIEDDLILRAGLAITPEDGRPAYDRFRGRLIIPIQDVKGRVVAFGGRALAPEAQPKYLNSPETELFKKGETLFNGHRARQEAFDTNAVVVVEGYLDAIAVYQGGVKGVVATLGTAFTEEQIGALWRLAPEPVICFDGDKAGRAAAYRAMDRILPALKTGFAFKFAFLPGGQDPDDLVRTAGISAFRTIVDEARSFWDVLWAREVEAARLDSENGQAVFEKRMKEMVSTIGDETLRRRYQLVARLQISDFLWRLNRKQVSDRLSRSPDMSHLPNLLAGEPTRLVGLERIFIGMCVHYPHLLERHQERIARMTYRGRHEGTPFVDFVRDLARVVNDAEASDCRVFYNLMGEGFFRTLDFLHGRQAAAFDGRELPWGHNLFARFPVLQCVPDSFVEDCFENFLEILWLRDLEDELHHGVAILPSVSDEGEMVRLETLQQEILGTRERVLHRELELSEEASQYRSAGGTRFAIAPNPRGIAPPIGAVAVLAE